MTDTASTRPRSGTIKTATKIYGPSRSAFYAIASEHPGLFRKWGRSTIVDFDMLDRIFDELPVLTVKPRAPRKPERSKRRR